jgi:hypothetical protein
LHSLKVMWRDWHKTSFAGSGTRHAVRN